MGLTATDGIEVVYTRSDDGCRPVRVVGPKHLELVCPGGQSMVFTSARQLLINVTGGDRHWTFDRYFRKGRYAPAPGYAPALPVTEWFTGWEPNQAGVVVRKGPDITVGRQVPVLPDVRPDVLAARVVVETEADIALGIDLVNRAEEVVKLLWAGFGHWIRTGGYDAEEVIQEVFKGILVRNAGTCPFDAGKASFGHYVHMVCKGVMSNYHRKHRRQRESEQVGMKGFTTRGDWGDIDVASNTALAAPESWEQERLGLSQATAALDAHLAEQGGGRDTEMARTILPLIRDGYSRQDIAEHLGVPKSAVGRGLTRLRASARQWSESQ